MKTGLGADKLELETGARLKAAVALMSVVAVRLLALKEPARVDPQAPAEKSGLEPEELPRLGSRHRTTTYDYRRGHPSGGTARRTHEPQK